MQVIDAIAILNHSQLLATFNPNSWVKLRALPTLIYVDAVNEAFLGLRKGALSDKYETSVQ